MEGLNYEIEGFRVSTPLSMATYKAERLATDSIADLGSGIGVQSLEFARFSNYVISVERDPKRLEIARNNAKKKRIGNIKFREGDALEDKIIREVGKVDTTTSDPSSHKIGMQWEFSFLSPNPLEVVKKYSCDNFSFELPASLPGQLAPFNWEIEYTSLSGELKIMATYIGKIKK